MTSKDARGARLSAGKWKTRVSLIVGGLVVVAACLALRHFWGPGSASAQAPPRGQRSSDSNRRPANSTTTQSQTKPAASPSAPVNAKTARIRELSVMAVVNGQQITRQQLAQECLRRYGNDVLESIINKHVIWQACQQRKITISDQDVDNEIAQVAGKFGLSADRWVQVLAEERDISAEQYRREIIWPTLALRALAAEQIEVTEAELQQAFESEYGPRVKARLIAVTSRELADKLQRQAAAKPDEFGSLAKDHSEDQSSSVRGVIPPIRRHVGDPQLEQVAFSLKEGEVSPVVQVANQFIILKCEKRIPETFVADRFREDVAARLRQQIRDHKLRDSASQMFRQLQDAAHVVNVMNDPQKRQQMPGVAATINGQQIPILQLSEECLIRHGEEVLEGEINRQLLLQELARRRQGVIEPELDAEIARAADAYGYIKADGSPDIDRWLRDVTEEGGATVELYVRDAVWPTVALKKLVDNRVTITEDDLQKGFVSNYGERVEALAIVLGSMRQAQKVWDLAKHNPTDQFFGELAHQYSIEAGSRENFGKVPPIPRYGGQPNIEEEAFKLSEESPLSGIIAIGDRFVIMRYQGRTDPKVKQMDEQVRDELTKDIRERKLRMAMTEEFDRLKESAQIDNFLAGTSQSGTAAAQTATRPPAKN